MMVTRYSGSMKQVRFLTVLLTALCSLRTVHSFLSVAVPARSCHTAPTAGRRTIESPLTALAASSATKTGQKSTLTEHTTWKLRFVLQGVLTKKGKKVDEIFVATCKFLEEDGYEPPQGALQQVELTDDRLKVTASYWKLSEDPNDRRDGLWIWGLFKEPLYPFMLLQLETAAVPLSGNADADGEAVDEILPMQLYAQINHSRDNDMGVILQGAELNIRQMETMKADPFGVSMVDIFEEKNVGTLSIQVLETK
jgi:hypothetical protein